MTENETTSETGNGNDATRWGRLCFKCLIAAAIGSAVIVLAAPFVRTFIGENAVNSAEGALSGGETRLALGRFLGLSDSWLSRYPSLTHRVAVDIVRCYARLPDFERALEQADLVRRTGGIRPQSASGTALGRAWQQIQDTSDSIAAAALPSLRHSESLNPWAGYEVLAEELRSSGRFSELGLLSKKILAIEPNNVLGRKAAAWAASSATRMAAAGTTAPPAPQAPKPTPQASEQVSSPVPEPRAPEPPATETDAAVKRWGLVRNEAANVYNVMGDRILIVPACTFVNVLDIKNTKTTETAVCSLNYRGAQFPNVLVKTADLEICDGSLDQVSQRERDLRVKAILQELKIASLSKAVSARASAANPFLPEYTAAKRKYDSYWAEVNRMKSQLATATDSTRMQLMDELRKKKGLDVELDTKLKEAKQKMDGWTSAHPASTDPQASPEIQGLEKELARIREELRSLEQR